MEEDRGGGRGGRRRMGADKDGNRRMFDGAKMDIVVGLWGRPKAFLCIVINLEYRCVFR